MKQLRWMVALFVVVFLAACSSQVATLQPALTTGPLETAEAYLLRGDRYSEIQDYDHAILDYDQAIRLKPDYAEAYNNRGFAYYWKGDATHAIADYSRAIQLRANYAYAYNNRGAAYMMSGHSDQAISDFDRAIELQTDFPQAYTNRGNAYLRLGRIGLAFADFRRGGQNPVGSLAALCVIATLVVLLAAMLARRFWLTRSRKVSLKDDLSSQS